MTSGGLAMARGWCIFGRSGDWGSNFRPAGSALHSGLGRIAGDWGSNFQPAGGASQTGFGWIAGDWGSHRTDGVRSSGGRCWWYLCGLLARIDIRRPSATCL